MLREIVLYLLRWLETSLDPDLQLRVEALQAKVKAHEENVKRLLDQIEVGKGEIADLLITLASDAIKAEELNAQIEATKDRLQKQKDELDRLSADDRLRVDL